MKKEMVSVLGLLADLTQKLQSGAVTPEELDRFLKRQNPLTMVAGSDLTPEDLIPRTTQLLSRRFGRRIEVDPLPTEFTEENLARWARFNLKPIFLPNEEIGENRNLKDWVKPEAWFYQQIKAGEISPDSAVLHKGWYLADFTLGVDYSDGSQVFPNDPLAPLIAGLRGEGKVGKYDNTPPGSRFAITNDEWRDTVMPALAEELGLKPAQVRLERAIEFNAIGNLYDPINRGKFSTWEWFEDVFEDSLRLYGGHCWVSGLANVSYYWSDNRSGRIAGRPLVSF